MSETARVIVPLVALIVKRFSGAIEYCISALGPMSMSVHCRLKILVPGAVVSAIRTLCSVSTNIGALSLMSST